MERAYWQRETQGERETERDTERERERERERPRERPREWLSKVQILFTLSLFFYFSFLLRSLRIPRERRG